MNNLLRTTTLSSLDFVFTHNELRTPARTWIVSKTSRTLRCLIKFVLSMSLLTLTCCSQKIDIQIPDPENPDDNQNQVSGSIILPEGSKADFDGAQVITSVGIADLNGLSYKIDTIGNFSVSILADKSEKVMLMRYNYPGQTDNDISVESTAIALIMNSLIVHTLTPSAKINLIKSIVADSNFPALSDAISKLVINGESFTENVDPQFASLISKLFESASRGRILQPIGRQNPITIKTSNTELVIQNNEVAHTYISGIYKDKVLQRLDTIFGMPQLATSITQAMQGYFGDGFGIPEPKYYSMNGNGKYDIKIRSGKLFSKFDTREDTSAMIMNLATPIVQTALDILPAIGSACPAFRQGLIGTIGSRILEYPDGGYASLQTESELMQFYEGLLVDCLSHSETYFSNCKNVPESTTRFGKLYAAILRTYTTVTLANKTINAVTSFGDYILSNPKIDTCFQVRGLKTYPCHLDLVPNRVQIVSGDKQQAAGGSILLQPLIIRVQNKSGSGIPGIKITWTVKAGNGKLTSSSVVTGDAGTAMASWILGDESKQVVEVVAHDYDGTPISGSPIAFNATATYSEILVKLFGQWKLDAYRFKNQSGKDTISDSSRDYDFLFSENGDFEYGSINSVPDGTYSVKGDFVTIDAGGFGGGTGGYQYRASFPAANLLLLKGSNQGFYQEFHLRKE